MLAKFVEWLLFSTIGYKYSTEKEISNVIDRSNYRKSIKNRKKY